ncbi:LysR family transcriptional regulator [Variovorax sp. DAIF25]|uniref:LysR family transcriptional regulator n=1 Tax=Variovorax sp. DAIF25 TaxID=3080983 RepID=UPI003D6BE9DA
MKIKSLQYFLQIAEIGSLTQAATVLYIAQPALSRQMQQLEDELGVTLFNRSERGVTLTDAGRLLKTKATSLLRDFDSLSQDMRDAFNEPSGTVTVAMPPSLFHLVTMPAVREYHRTYPKVSLRMFEAMSAVMNAWSMVQAGNADLAVVTNIEPLASLENEPFVTEALCLVGPPEAKLGMKAPVELSLLPSLPLVLTSRPNSLRLMIEAAAAKARLPLDIVMETNSSRGLLGSVEAGLGYTALPYSGCYQALLRKQISAAPIAGMQVAWTLIRARTQSLSTAAERMRELLIGTARSQIESGLWLTGQQ